MKSNCLGIQKRRGLQLTSSPVVMLRFGVNRNPHLESGFLIGYYFLTVYTNYPAVYKLEQLTFDDFIEDHYNTSFLQYSTGINGFIFKIKPKNPRLDPGFKLSKRGM